MRPVSSRNGGNTSRLPRSSLICIGSPQSRGLNSNPPIRLLTYKDLNGLAPEYLRELLVPYTTLRTLRSTENNQLTPPRCRLEKFGRRRLLQLHQHCGTTCHYYQTIPICGQVSHEDTSVPTCLFHVNMRVTYSGDPRPELSRWSYRIKFTNLPIGEIVCAQLVCNFGIVDIIFQSFLFVLLCLYTAQDLPVIFPLSIFLG